MKWKIDWFLTGMFVTVALAWFFPAPGAKGGWLQPEILTKAGVALIFFLHGVALSFAAMRAGAMNWRVHLLVQGTAFGIFPLIGLAIYHSLPEAWLTPELRLGFFYLCALPSTVSSSVAMTAAARGNVPTAVFNATLSSLLGVVLTPLWVSLVLESKSTTAAAFPIGDVILDLVKWLVLPLIVGQLMRPLLGEWAKRNKKVIQLADRGTILMLVYTSFCDSVVAGVWTGRGATTLILSAVGSVAIFFTVFAIVGLICDVMRLNMEDRIAAQLCGSKKSLATGVPMAQLIFEGNPALGIYLLPIMIYHPLQLIITAMLASRWAKRSG
ncbi:MAG TPA: bile acid:sodium symporter family protein [Caulifigura sp.]|nr:bile acid:sodium symporter family protein [Caulifigura sp.]